jgi:hypothetical protein
MAGKIITEIELIQRYARDREDENFRFRSFVKHRLDMPDEELDARVRQTTNAVWEQIDCTRCAHCCRTMQVIVDEEDVRQLAGRLGMTVSQFERKYVARNEFQEKHFASMPCPFLKDNLCSVYEDRPRSCRDFPYLHSEGFRGRMLMVIANTEVCPIVFNTYERLKHELPMPRRKPRSPQRRRRR